MRDSELRRHTFSPVRWAATIVAMTASADAFAPMRITRAHRPSPDRATQRSAFSAPGRQSVIASSSAPDVEIIVCTDSLCDSLGAEQVLQQLRERSPVRVCSSGCLGRCGMGVQICVENMATGGSALVESVDDALGVVEECLQASQAQPVATAAATAAGGDDRHS